MAILVACCVTAGSAQQATPTPPGAATPAASSSSPAKPAAKAAAPAAKVKQKKPKPVLPPKFAKKLAANPQLVARIQPLLPKDTPLETATHGFKSEKLFIATLHAAHDLNILFDKLKGDITGTEQDSLGQAIWNYHPELDLNEIEARAKAAEQQAKTDIQETRPPKRKDATH